jgi:hypothetical protein
MFPTNGPSWYNLKQKVRVKKYVREVEKVEKVNWWIEGNRVAEKFSFSPFTMLT